MPCAFHGDACELERIANYLTDYVRKERPKTALVVLLVDASGDGHGHSSLAVDGMSEDLGAAFLDDAAKYLRGRSAEALS